MSSNVAVYVRVTAVACLVFSPSTAMNFAEEAKAKRPNIVLFLVDDMGWQDTSVPFHTATTELNRRYRTPNLERLDHTESMYAAMVEGMDKSLGDILDNVGRHGLSDNTIVLFMSDNGGLSASGRGGMPHTHNKPLSSGKGSAHEGGVRVPMIAHWPGVTKPGSTCSQPVIIEDFFPPIPVAHRGLLRHAPENTLPAFAVCLELGMGFELDIRTTKDDHLVILHDDSVKRTTNGSSRSIRDMTLNEVKQLDAGSWFDPAFAGVRIPTLDETLALVKARKRGSTIVALNVKQLTPAGEAKLVSLVQQYGLLDESFAFDQNAEMSRRLKKLNPKFRIGQNVNRQSLDDRLQEDVLDVFLLTFAPTREDVNRLHEHKKQVLFNYAGAGDVRRNLETWKQVRDARIDGMLTDYPLECRALWRTTQP